MNSIIKMNKYLKKYKIIHIYYKQIVCVYINSFSNVSEGKYSMGYN